MNCYKNVPDQKKRFQGKLDHESQKKFSFINFKDFSNLIRDKKFNLKMCIRPNNIGRMTYEKKIIYKSK